MENWALRCFPWMVRSWQPPHRFEGINRLGPFGGGEVTSVSFWGETLASASGRATHASIPIGLLDDTDAKGFPIRPVRLLDWRNLFEPQNIYKENTRCHSFSDVITAKSNSWKW